MAGQSAVSLHGRVAGIDIQTNRIFSQGRPFNLVMTASPDAAASNSTTVSMQLVDFEGKNCAGVFNFDIWLSDAATGAGLTATTASGTVGNGGNAGGTLVTAAGTDIGTYTTKKALYIQTDATGKYTLKITDTSKTAFKVCAINPSDGQAVVGLTLATASYG